MAEEKPVASSLQGEARSYGAEGEPPTSAQDAPHETKTPQTPSPEEQFKAWVLSTTQRLEKLEKDGEQNRNIMVKIDEGLANLTPMVKEWQATKAGNPGGEGPFSWLKEVRGIAKDLGVSGGGPEGEAYYAQIGHKVVDGITDSAIKKIVGAVGKEATHVVLKE